MNRNYLIGMSGILLVGLFAGVWQYLETIKIETVSAVTVGTPNPGHTWSSMECSANNICIDTTNNKIGIGTNTPDTSVYSKLDIVGGIRFGGASGNHLIANSANFVMNKGDAAGGFYWRKNTTTGNPAAYTDLMYLDNSGSLGVGTTTPTGKFQIAGTAIGGIYQDGADRPSLGITGVYPQIALMSSNSANASHGSTIMLGGYDAGASGSHKHWSIGTAGTGSTFLDIGYHAGTDTNPHAGIRNYDGSTFMTILNTGRVGIGTTVPSAVLDVGVGASQCCAIQTPNISLAQASSTNGQMAWLQFHNGGESEAYIRLAGGGTGLRAGARRLEIGDNQGVNTGLSVQGNITSTAGDVCNGTGKCLSSVFQSNVVIAGANPTCPVGSGTLLMKGYNGTWYTANNASITTWSQIYCGTLITSDGTPLLVNGNHTQGACTSIGGAIVSDGTYNMCSLALANCPSGWSQYNQWSTTTANSYCDCWGCGTTGSHTWANHGIESVCSQGICSWPYGCSGYLSATRTYIGCY